MRFVFTIPVYNSEPWIKRCLESVKKQFYSNWIALIVGDPSTDKTNDIIEKYIEGDKRFIFTKNTVRKYMMANRVDSIQKAGLEDEDILIFLDGDDWLSDRNVLTYLSKIYSNPKVWLTWGSHIVIPCGEKGLSASEISFPLSEARVRKGDWYFSHLKSAKYFLWKNIKNKDFRDDATGEYYQTAGDLAYMFPMLEMAGEKHCKYIERILYVYNYGNPLADQIFSRAEQEKSEDRIRACPSYPLKTKEELMKGKDKVMVLFFSKDRTLQLYATIESFIFNCEDIDNTEMVVLYKATTKEYNIQYETLKRDFRNVRFVEETDFASQILEEINKYPYIFTQTDDNIFVKKFRLETIIDSLERHKEAIGFSLRLGKNIDYCYMADTPQKFSEYYEKIERGILKYNWVLQSLDFEYPLEESGSVYRTIDILPLLTKHRPRHPITYEGCLCSNRKDFQNSHPYLLCFEQSVVFSLPLNTFRKEINIRSGRENRFSIEALTIQFDKGKKINIEPLQSFIPNSPHQEVEVDFIQREK